MQVWAGHDAGGEALVHAMCSLYNEQNMEAVLLADAENAYNAVNRKAFSQSFNIIFSSISSFMHSYYFKPSHLFAIGVAEITSSEGTMQGDPVQLRYML